MSRGRAARRSASRTRVQPLADLVVDAVQAEVIETLTLPPRAAKRASLPEPYRSNLALARFIQSLSPDGTVWSHQALALEQVAAGRNLLITTGTGSGKSLVFQLPLLREMAEGEGKAVVFYPQKALSSDQLRRWRELLAQAGLGAELVGEINGETPMEERDAILDQSRIILATPDVFHTWGMRLQSAPAMQRFLKVLRYAVIDEAHVFDGVFGSNSAYLFRRINRAAARAQGVRHAGIQYIAASATIGNPIAHIEALTGLSFVHVADEHNGAPARGMTVLHIDGPDRGSAAETMLAEIIAALAGKVDEGAIVAFIDGRQGVERVSRKLGQDEIQPYRSGYAGSERRSIALALNSGKLRACIATSALELGVDVAAFRIGFNLGIPSSRRGLRQRMGRVGRADSGVFGLLAPRNAFAKLGASFADFISGPVEDSHLYLENRAVQFQQAACLLKETGGASIASEDWPAGFAEIYEGLRANAPVPADLAMLAEISGDNPHFAFPLRQIADTSFALHDVRTGAGKIGTITQSKALREAYPGATYLHNRRAYKVVSWRHSGFGSEIRLEQIRNAARTMPMLANRVEVSLDPADVLAGHAKVGAAGALSERRMRITETVHGFKIHGKSIRYAEASKTNRNLVSQSRQFDSTGVVLQIVEPWFAGETKAETRKAIAKALCSVLRADQGLLPGDIGWSQSGISLRSRTSSKASEASIVIFDAMQGGLRLSEALFTRFDVLLERLRKGSDAAGEDRLLDIATIERLERWYGELEDEWLEPEAAGQVGGIFAAGSELGALIHGRIVPLRLTGHQVMNITGSDQLMYSYVLEDGKSGWVSHDCLQPIGRDWQLLSSDGGVAGEVCA